jgi:NAD+ kinase
VRTVTIIPKRTKAEATELAERVAAWLTEHGHEAMSESGAPVAGTKQATAQEIAARSDLIVVLGGDGTLLHAAHLCQSREIPIIGVNLGTLGFMTEIRRDRLFHALERAVAGAARVDRRMKLRVVVHRGREVLIDAEVLNDVVINKPALARIADIEALADGLPVTTYKADGVIVSTPTGSSAYSLAAGGPLIHPVMRALLLTPICPHTLTQRPIVLPDDQEIGLVIRSEEELYITLDGQSGRALQQGDRVVVCKAPTAALLVREDGTSYYGILRDKLRWGER